MSKYVEIKRLQEIVSDETINQGSEFAIMARMLLCIMKKEPVAYSLKFRNMDGVISGKINTNTTFATKLKAESYGRGGSYKTQGDGSLKWIADPSLDAVIVPLYEAPDFSEAKS